MSKNVNLWPLIQFYVQVLEDFIGRVASHMVISDPVDFAYHCIQLDRKIRSLLVDQESADKIRSLYETMDIEEQMENPINVINEWEDYFVDQFQNIRTRILLEQGVETPCFDNSNYLIVLKRMSQLNQTQNLSKLAANSQLTLTFFTEMEEFLKKNQLCSEALFPKAEKEDGFEFDIEKDFKIWRKGNPKRFWEMRYKGAGKLKKKQSGEDMILLLQNLGKPVLPGYDQSKQPLSRKKNICTALAKSIGFTPEENNKHFFNENGTWGFRL